MLSGYCIHRAGLRAPDRQALGFYALRRGFRILPVYGLGIGAGLLGFAIAARRSAYLAAALSGTSQIDSLCIAAKALTVPALVPQLFQCAFLGNAPLATVMVEIVLYATYGAAFALLVWRGRERIIWLVCAGVFGVSVVLFSAGVEPGFYAWWQNGSVFGFLPYWWLGVLFVNRDFAAAVKRRIWARARLKFGSEGAMSGNFIRIPTVDGCGFGAGLAVPEAGNGPGLVLLDDSGGADAARQLAELYAAEGYVVLCPEKSGTDDDVASAIAALRGRRECTGKLAALGFGRGGNCAMQALAQKQVECAICYGLADPEAASDLAARIDRPMVLHFAGSDPAAAPDAVARISDAFAGRPQIAIHVYPGAARGFERKNGANYHRTADGLAHSRTIALLRRVLGPHYDLEALWEAHTRYEFATRDADATMATMVADPYVNHVPVMTGGVGARDLARFYANHFIPNCPADFAMVPISRTIGADRLVDEMVVSFTHDVEIDWMLPGVPPTGRRVEVPVIVVVGFRGDKLYHEHIHWDQASVLVQIGLLDPQGLPVAGIETAKKLLDETLPSNTLMKRWGESAPR